ncbi:uncharacterized protein LOC119655482 isoform X2 [Hermetia illucens]|uniref:uncharacterized protein LOC119655482 isoform X2 n=1 Tax=Hermetia illucens TaxID=343691 RepID=UPI0018CC1AF1|nr:uncharacterized protein LOC119655482 isoform X2 [Hermetia illucens]
MSFLPILLTSCISAILRKSFIVNSMFMETHDADFAEYPSIVFFKRELHLEVSCLGSLDTFSVVPCQGRIQIALIAVNIEE